MPVVVTDLHFAYGDRVLFDGISCEFLEGRLTAVVGPSGSGKTTLIAMIVGLLPVERGNITYPGGLLVDSRLDRTRVGWVMQTANVFVRRTVLDNVALPLRVATHSTIESRMRAIDALQAVGLGSRLDDRCGVLSGGERQRVALARAIATSAPLLIADEPTSSLDRANRDKLLDSLRIAAVGGAIVIVATHDAAVWDACDDRIDL
jgi:ABC-type lipoprotein export system ATPase subunit